MGNKLTWELLKQFFKTKLGIFTAAAVTAVVVGTGTIIFLNLQEDSFRSIVVFELEGEATVSRDNTNIAAYKGMQLISGDIITQHSTGYLRLLLDEDKYITLEPDSEVRLLASGNSVDSTTKIDLTKGAVTNEIHNKLSANSSFEITTPCSTMAVRGTIFRVSLTQTKDGEYLCELDVFEGSIAVRLIMPDGTISEEKVTISSNTSALIRGDSATSEFVYTDQEIRYEELPEFLIERLIYLKENNLLSTEITTIQQLLDILNPPVPETEETTAETTEKSSVEKAAPENEENTQEVGKASSPEETTQPQLTLPTDTDPSQVPPTETQLPPTQSTAKPESKTPPKKESSSSSSTPEETPLPTYTVTFIDGSSDSTVVFATQSATSGQPVKKPLLSPNQVNKWYTSNGSEYSFSAPLTDNLTLYSDL